MENEDIVKFWMGIKYLKGVIIQLLYTFGGSYMIFTWYYNRTKCAFSLLQKGILCSIVIVLFYGIIDVFYLGGNQFAKNCLVNLNPYIHAINTDGSWWPPLLWRTQQLRSLFAEPSYFGIFAAFASPWLWLFIARASKWNKLFLMVLWIGFSFCLFLTQARTGVALFVGEMFLLVVGGLCLNQKGVLKNFVVIFLCAGIGLGGAISFLNHPNLFMFNDLKINIDSSDKKSVCNIAQDLSSVNTKNDVKIKSIDYLNKNLGSLAGINQRSNGNRYAIMYADINIGLHHPLLGVGSGLRNIYIPQYLPNNWESYSKGRNGINYWLKEQEEKGIWKAGFPRLGEYTSRFAETGIIGLGFFMLPAFIIMKRAIQKLIRQKDFKKQTNKDIYILISFIGTLAAGIGDTVNITYCYWVMLAMEYVFLYSVEETQELNE